MPESDEQLVLRARLGDREAYGELVARHQGRVRGWLRHLCRNHAEADDLAQDAFVRAWTRLGNLKNAARFAPWLMRIAYNGFLQSRRSQRRRERMLERLAQEQRAGEPWRNATPGKTPKWSCEGFCRSFRAGNGPW